MSKVTQSGLCGSVKTMRTEFAEWHVGKEEWQAPQHTTLHQFRADAQINERVSHNPNGSVSRSSRIRPIRIQSRVSALEYRTKTDHLLRLTVGR
jgi:hypothetical protein